MADKEPLKKRIQKYLDKIDLVSFGNTEYEAGLSEELDPIAQIGFDPEVVKTIRENREGFNPDTTDNAYYNLDGKEGVSIGANLLASKAVISHEFRHRGFGMLSEMYEEDPEHFSKEYGEGAVEILKRFMNYSSAHELDNEMWDNLDEEFLGPNGRTTSYVEHHENNIKTTKKFQEYRSGEDKSTSDDDKEFFDSYLELERAASDMLVHKRTNGNSYEPKEDLSGPEGWANKITDKVTKNFNQGGVVESNEDYFARLQREIDEEASGLNTQSVTDKYNAEMAAAEKRIEELGLVKESGISTKEFASFALDFVPIVGDVKGALDTVADVYKELKKEEPNYAYVAALAGTGVAATAVGMVPLVGDAAAAALRNGAKRMGLEGKLDLALETQDKIVGEVVATIGRETVDRFGRGVGGVIKDVTGGTADALADAGSSATSTMSKKAATNTTVNSFASAPEKSNDVVGSKMDRDNSFKSDVVGSKMDRDNSFSGRSQKTESESPTTESQTSRAFFKGGLATSEEDEPVMQMSETSDNNVVPDITSRPTRSNSKSRLDLKRRINKGMSYPELVYDNLIGSDNNYDSFGEQMGRAFNEDEVGFLKTAGTEIAKGAWEFVKSPIEGTKEIVKDIYNSGERLATDDLDSRLQDMFGVSYDQATDEQVNKVREATIGDTLAVAELIPSVGVVGKGASVVGKSAVKAIANVDNIKKTLGDGWEPVPDISTPELVTNNSLIQKPNRSPSDVLPQSEASPFMLETGKGTSDGFYSPVITGINNMPISKDKGITGQRAAAFLSKKVNTSKTALHWSGLLNHLESDKNKNKLYTKPQLLRLAEAATPNIKVFKKSNEPLYRDDLDSANIRKKYRGLPDYVHAQRVQKVTSNPDNNEIWNDNIEPIAGQKAVPALNKLRPPVGRIRRDQDLSPETVESLKNHLKKHDDYAELLAINTNQRGVEYDTGHFNRDNIVAHARVSYYTDADSGDSYSVLEEIQSDPVQSANRAQERLLREGKTSLVEEFSPRFASKTENLKTNLELRNLQDQTKKYKGDIGKFEEDLMVDVQELASEGLNEFGDTVAERLPKSTGDVDVDRLSLTDFYREQSSLSDRLYQEALESAKSAVDEGYIAANEVTKSVKSLYTKSMAEAFEMETHELEGLIEDTTIELANVKDKTLLAAIGDRMFGEHFYDMTETDSWDNILDRFDTKDGHIKMSQYQRPQLSVLRRTDATRMSILMAMRDAKSKGINVMYVPEPDVMSRAHGFSREMSSNVYQDSLTKALNIINNQSGNKIKISRGNPKGRMFTDAEITHPASDTPNTSRSIKIDFSDIEMPEGPVSFNYNKGGLVPKPKGLE